VIPDNGADGYGRGMDVLSGDETTQAAPRVTLGDGCSRPAHDLSGHEFDPVFR
jgi:hypothetical protein